VETLKEIEPTIGNIEWELEPVTTANTYEYEIKGSTGQWFGVVNNEGALQFPCFEEKKGGCPAGAEWDK
jgi:hypothetical protein